MRPTNAENKKTHKYSEIYFLIDYGARQRSIYDDNKNLRSGRADDLNNRTSLGRRNSLVWFIAFHFKIKQKNILVWFRIY